MFAIDDGSSDLDKYTRRLVHRMSSANMPRVVGGYFGTREPDLFLRNKRFAAELSKCRAFVDITAGTGQFPLALAAAGKSIGMIDRCLYISSLFRAWSVPEPVDPAELQRRWSAAPRGQLAPGLEGIASPEVSALVAGIIQEHGDDPLAVHAVGRAMFQFFVWRGRAFVPTTPDKRPTVEVTEDEYLRAMLACAARVGVVRLGLAARRGRGQQIWAVHGDSYHDLKRAPRALLRGAMVYMDTAWPYEKKLSRKNPYEFFWNVVDPILRGDRAPIKTSRSWTLETPYESIMADIGKIVDRAFSRGVSSFVLCSQSTNYPEPRRVFADVPKYSGARLAGVETVADYSVNAKVGYENYWAFYRPRRKSR